MKNALKNEEKRKLNKYNLIVNFVFYYMRFVKYSYFRKKRGVSGQTET